MGVAEHLDGVGEQRPFVLGEACKAAPAAVAQPR